MTSIMVDDEDELEAVDAFLAEVGKIAVQVQELENRKTQLGVELVKRLRARYRIKAPAGSLQVDMTRFGEHRVVFLDGPDTSEETIH